MARTGQSGTQAGRRPATAELIVLYWRNIPAQVIVKRGREVAKRHLSERFEVAMAKAAMRGQLRDSESYLAEWRRTEPVPCGDDLEVEAAAAAARLEADYDNELLDRLIASGGRA
jgi:hypothetical protein